MPSRRDTVVRAAGCLVLALGAIAGCADAPVAGPVPAPGATSATTRQEAPADRRAADVAYAQAMLPHVLQGLELTGMVPGRVADPELARLVVSMDNVDAEEQGQLIGQLHLWNAPVPGEDGVPLATMPGMADAGTLARLRTLRGPAFDRAWLEVMIAHHQGGGAMSRAYLARGPEQTLGGVAQAQVVNGGRQIQQMQQLLASP